MRGRSATAIAAGAADVDTNLNKLRIAGETALAGVGAGENGFVVANYLNTHVGDVILAEGYGFDGMGDTASLTSPGGFANMNPTERKNWGRKASSTAPATSSTLRHRYPETKGAQGLFDCSCYKPPLFI